MYHLNLKWQGAVIQWETKTQKRGRRCGLRHATREVRSSFRPKPHQFVLMYRSTEEAVGHLYRRMSEKRTQMGERRSSPAAPLVARKTQERGYGSGRICGDRTSTAKATALFV